MKILETYHTFSWYLPLFFILLDQVATASLSLTEPQHVQFKPRPIAQNIKGRGSGGSTPFPILGVPGNVYPRLEVLTMYIKYPDQWNLFILGLQRFQNIKQDDKLSYYQIAGIHGVPNVPWNGARSNPASNNATGYCTHGSVLFPAWHRPYVALFEEILVREVNAVVRQFSGAQRRKYSQAASSLRLPYWDWAASPSNGQATFPSIFTSTYITVDTPQGQQTISNPLYQYSFHPLDQAAMISTPWSWWSTTLRYPTSDDPSASSQNSQAQTMIENARLSIKDSLYSMFINCQSYLAMSNDAASSSTPSCSNSLESIHDNIHGLVGGSNNGHMTWLSYSAFDPVFWMHHANVDRLFAMWQAIYPNTYGASQVAETSTYTISEGSTQGPDSPLSPFYVDDNRHFWTTNTVRQWQVFGYDYPEFVNSNGSPSSIRNYVNKLYGPSASKFATFAGAKRNFKSRSSFPARVESKMQTRSGARYEYVANIATPRFALNGSYSIHLFIGQPLSTAKLSAWSFDENFIGAVYIIARPGLQHTKLLTTRAVPLTRALRRLVFNQTLIQGKALKDLRRSSVSSFLRSRLYWHVLTSDNLLVDIKQVPGFQISVAYSEAQPSDSPHQFPRYKPFTILRAITDSRKGGLSFNQSSAWDDLI